MANIYAKISELSTRREEGEGSHVALGRRPQGRWQQGRYHVRGSNQSYAPRLVKLDFPEFNGSEDPTSWICRAEQFFCFHETPVEDQVALASFHL